MIRVINVISDTNIGGAGTMLIYLMKLTSKEKFKHLVVIPEKSLLGAELKKIGVSYVELPGIGEKSLSLTGIKSFLRVYKEFRPDIVHTHASLSGRIAARLYRKCKIVHTRHSVFDQSKAKKSFPLKQIAGTINNLFSDIITAVSPAAKENIVETGTNPKKVVVIFNGVNALARLSEAEKIAEREKYGLAPDDFVCVIMARLEDVKGHRYVLEAAELLKSYKEIKFLIAGTGSIENELKEKAMAMGLSNCIFTGFVHEIGRLVNIMDLQINASYGTEATSFALLEGMSLGVPAVVSDFGGNPYVILDGSNGIVVGKKDARQLSEGILKLYNNKDVYTVMSNNSLVIFNERFTSQVMVKKIEQVYEKLVMG